MLPTARQPFVMTHWGGYRVEMKNGKPVSLKGAEGDPDPSPISNAMMKAVSSPSRIRHPAIRASFLRDGAAASRERRGSDPFIEVSWDEALDVVAREITRVKAEVGNTGIFGGSYGWSSAGRFHHAQSQIHRFLNCIGGCVRSVQNYSHGAGETILPYVVGDKRGLTDDLTTWSALAGHTQLIVMFGGTPHKNAQINSGGISRHVLREGMSACRRGGAEFVSISPIASDTLAEFSPQWIAPRPNTDVALMLGLAHTLVTEGLHDADFLARYTVGFERFQAYLTGATDGIAKSAGWAAEICEVPVEVITELARTMAKRRTFIMMSWSLQRADHGEQPYWMTVTLASMLGGIGRAGEGFGFGYGAVNGAGQGLHPFAWPSLPQGSNAVTDYIPVARIADMLLHPGDTYDFNGARLTYPDIRMVYWAGGNPFHHHQDLNRFIRAWRKPEVIVTHEIWWNATARHADIVLPATTQFERNDIACSNRDRFIAASHCVLPPVGAARNDFDIFSGLASRLGVHASFTQNMDEEGWLRFLYQKARDAVTKAGMHLPDFDTFWNEGIVTLPEPQQKTILMHDFRMDPARFPLKTPSGRIEIFSEKIANFDYADCPGHAAWLEPREWLGGKNADTFPLHLISNQPATKLHSQYDHGEHSRSAKIQGREPIQIHPEDARARGIADGDVVRVFNDRGACLAGALLYDGIRRGVVQMATGAWYDPLEPGKIGTLDKHGNPNVLTYDAGTSRLAQATSAQTCLVDIHRFEGELPPISCYSPPEMEPGIQLPSER